MNQQIGVIIAFVLGIPLGGFCLYLLARIISAGYYRSKKEFFEWYDTTRKPVHTERRKKAARVEEEEILP